MRKALWTYNMIVAVDQGGGFGKDGKIPWYIPEDLKKFKELTTNNICVMGRKTYFDMYDMRVERMKKKNPDIATPVKFESILPNRTSYVVTSTHKELEGATVIKNLGAVLNKTKDDDKRDIFILGGFRMFVEALPFTNTVYMTIVKGNYNCDRHFPVNYVQEYFSLVGDKQTDNAYYAQYKRKYG